MWTLIEESCVAIDVEMLFEVVALTLCLVEGRGPRRMIEARRVLMGEAQSVGAQS